MKFNSIAKSSLVVLSLLLAVAGAHAQSAALAHVPFAFKVGTTQMPAGTYALDNDGDTHIIVVRNLQSGASAMVMGQRESPSKKTNKLIFHRYGSRYFLTAILGHGGSWGMSLPISRQEKELQVALAPASNRSNVEIASK